MIIAAITMPFYCVGFYVNARFGIDWIVLFFNVRTRLISSFAKHHFPAPTLLATYVG